MSISLRVMVDDTDPGVSYTGNWILDRNSKDNLGNYGAPFQSTNHHVEGTGSFSYTFSGTYVGIFGTTLDGNDPVRTCQVDGVTIPNNHIGAAENWFMHCEVGGLSDGRHTIVVTVPTANPNGYWFDFLMYIPSASVSRDNAALMIENSDPSMNYGAGWSKNGPGQVTSVNGAVMTMDFTGRSLTWMGYYFSQLPYAPTTATWSIDGGKPVSFNLNGIKSQSTGAEFNQRFFSTGILPAGRHTLRVVYNGNSNTTPLSVYNVVVQNGASAGASVGGVPSGGSSGGSPPAAAPSPSTATVTNGAASTITTVVPPATTSSSSEPQSSTVVVVGTGTSAVTVTVAANSTVTQTSNPASGTNVSSGTSIVTGSTPTSSGITNSNTNNGTSADSLSGSSGNTAVDTSKETSRALADGKHTNIGMIAGIVTGILGLLIFLILLFFVRRRRNRKRRLFTKDINGSSAAIVQPFVAPRSSTPPPVMAEAPTSEYSSSSSMYLSSEAGAAHIYPNEKQQPVDVSRSAGPSTLHNHSASVTTSKPWSWQIGPLEPLRTPSHSLSTFPTPTSDSPESEIIMMHEDSGVRLPQVHRPGITIVEMPPSYSAN